MWFVLVATHDKIPALAAGIGRADLLKDPRFADPAKLAANMSVLTAIIDETFSSQPIAHWREVLDKAHIPYGLVRDPQDVINDPQLQANNIVVPLDGAGDSFCAGNDIQDFLKNPPGAGESPQARLIEALINFDKPIVAAVQGAAIGGGTTMLTHCDFVFAGESAKFRMPFIDLAVVPEFGTSYSVPARIGYLRAAELVLLGLPFDAKRAAALGLVTRVVADKHLLPTATAAAQHLAVKPPAALQSCKRLMRSSTRELLERAAKLENEEFSVRVRSAEAKEAFTAFIEKRKPNFDAVSEPKARAA